MTSDDIDCPDEHCVAIYEISLLFPALFGPMTTVTAVGMNSSGGLPGLEPSFSLIFSIIVFPRPRPI